MKNYKINIEWLVKNFIENGKDSYFSTDEEKEILKNLNEEEIDQIVYDVWNDGEIRETIDKCISWYVFHNRRGKKNEN